MVWGGPALVYSLEAAEVAHQLRLELSLLVRVLNQGSRIHSDLAPWPLLGQTHPEWPERQPT